jgi:Trp operon repressor
VSIFLSRKEIMNSLQEQRSNAVPWSKRMEVVARYMLLGNMRLVSEQMNISYNTLMAWKNSDWWPEMVDQLKRQKQHKTNENIVRLIEQSLEVMQDRLDNGDFVFDQKSGEIKRKPVSVRDATQIATNLLQRQQVQEELEQKLNVKTTTVQETLSLIAQELKKHNRITGPVEDAKVIELSEQSDNAIYDQREEGLQEGGGEVYEPSGSNQETS